MNLIKRYKSWRAWRNTDEARFFDWARGRMFKKTSRLSGWMIAWTLISFIPAYIITREFVVQYAMAMIEYAGLTGANFYNASFLCGLITAFLWFILSSLAYNNPKGSNKLDWRKIKMFYGEKYLDVVSKTALYQGVVAVFFAGIGFIFMNWPRIEFGGGIALAFATLAAYTYIIFANQIRTHKARLYLKQRRKPE